MAEPSRWKTLAVNEVVEIWVVMTFASFLLCLADILVDVRFLSLSLVSWSLPGCQSPGVLPLKWPFLLAVTRFNDAFP